MIRLLAREKEAAEEAATTTLYHFGDLEGGLAPGKNFATTPDREYAEQFVRMHGGTLNKLELPTARLKELEKTGAIEHRTDSIKGTSISGPEVRFKGTHIPATLLFENLEDGATVNDFLEWYPGVTREQVLAVLAFAERSLIDQSSPHSFLQKQTRE